MEYWEGKSKKELYDYWQDALKRERTEHKVADYYADELVKAHALLGRVLHQLSERWDTVNLTRYFPTDNLWGRRSMSNPTGKKEGGGSESKS